MGWEYSEKVKQLFLDAVHGKPGTHLGEIENPDGVGEHGSIACGDALKFSFRVKKNDSDPLKDMITEARYLTFGCTSAIAASEALCCLLEDRMVTPIEALKITNADIVEFLQGLPEQKIHCSVMGAEALEAAVFDWAKKRGVDLTQLGIESHTEEEEEGRMVCKCFGMTDLYIKRKIKELNLHTIPEITGAIKAGGGCMNCHHAPGGLQDLLDEVWGKEKTNSRAKPEYGNFVPLSTLGSIDAPPAPHKVEATVSKEVVLSPYQLAKKIEHVVESYIRPMLRKDGGDIEIFDIKDKMVYVELSGACAHCVGAEQTLKLLVENTLKSQVDEGIKIVQV